LYRSADELGWTLSEAHAVREKGKALLAGGKGENKGKPSGVVHGNIAPSLDTRSGGVTARAIVATTVLSFVQLRRLQFPTGLGGTPLGDRDRAEAAARTALAALGIAAAVLGLEDGFDLRSRCVLVPTDVLTFELVGRAGSARAVQIGSDDALDLLSAAMAAADEAGIPCRRGELTLRPSAALVDLIRRSRDHAVAIGDAGED
jgi:CRISPR-associated protein Csb1